MSQRGERPTIPEILPPAEHGEHRLLTAREKAEYVFRLQERTSSILAQMRINVLDLPPEEAEVLSTYVTKTLLPLLDEWHRFTKDQSGLDRARYDQLMWAEALGDE